MKLSTRIKKLLSGGLRPEDLAVKLNVSLATIYRWKTDPPKRPMRSLIAALDELEKRRA
jgi:transposase